ncbi:hypothetical protein FB384_004200 [Prauserella sediminis]|uniref:L-serine ammonia-lyase n=1 Tax=Prauserella sediminis TaxID=577680 RepID=A0A839XRB5_9PSEU|nr:hypothetical protein [Prauserella sediminis]
MLLGPEGLDPETVDPAYGARRREQIRRTGTLDLAGHHPITFAEDDISLMPGTVLPHHINTLRFTAHDGEGSTVAEQTYYSLGGGFVVSDTDVTAEDCTHTPDGTPAPHRFDTAADLLDICARTGLDIADVMLANESTTRRPDQIHTGLLRIWHGRNVGERAERGRRARRDRPDQRRRRRHPGCAVLRPPLPTHATHRRRGNPRRRRRPLPTHRGSHRHPVQTAGIDLRRRGRLPGRGRIRLLHGSRRSDSPARRHTGTDMLDKYKETSTGGLAVNVIEC